MKKLASLTILLTGLSIFIFAQEKKVVIGGIVLDSAGKPVQTYPVQLIVEREVIDVSNFKKDIVKKQIFSMATDQAGKFYFTWKLDDFYNKFYLDLMPAESFDTVQFQPLNELRMDVSLDVVRGRNIDIEVIVFRNPDWPKLLKLIELEGADSDKGKALRKYGFFEKETLEQMGDTKYTFWWYYSIGKAFKFDDKKLTKEFTFTPLKKIGAE